MALALGQNMTQKMINSLNQLWKNLPGLRGGTESVNLRLGDLLGPIAYAPVYMASVTLAAAATTSVSVPAALVGDVCSVVIATLHAGDTAPTTASASVTANGTVVITPISTPGHSDDTAILTVMRAVSATKATHAENPGA